MKTDLPHNCTILRLDTKSVYLGNGRWEDIPMRGNPDVRVSYGRWTEDDQGTWFLCEALSYSDYSGTKPTNESNARVFADDFSRGEGKWWVWADGGHDTTAILIRTLAYRNSSEIRDLIDGLADYPILDEDDETELEMEREMEGWEDYGRDDFKRSLVSYLEKRFADRGVETDLDGRAPDEIVDSLTDDQLGGLYMHRCQETNINGGSTCLWEGESHPHFFANEMAFGSDSSYHKEFGRDPWDGYVPSLNSEGKIDYHTGEIAGWEPICGFSPSCPRCGKVGPEINGDTDPLPLSLFEAPCAEYGCDVPPQGENADPAMAEIAAYILRSWDVTRIEGYNHLYHRDAIDIGPAFDRLASACEAKADRYAALALHFRRNERFPGLMLSGEIRKVTRGVLREIVSGHRPHPSAIAGDDMGVKPICCVVYGSSCCAHGESRQRDLDAGRKPFCIRVNTRGACSICGGTRSKEG